jgi:hypothetical protein
MLESHSLGGYSAFCLLGLVSRERFKINLSVPLVLEYEEVLLRELPNLAINPTFRRLRND